VNTRGERGISFTAVDAGETGSMQNDIRTNLLNQFARRALIFQIAGDRLNSRNGDLMPMRQADNPMTATDELPAKLMTK
jgi:hypothetical protein